MADGTIVAAVGTASTNGKTLASIVEAAMAQAVLNAHAQGITDDDQIRQLMKEARESVLG